MAEYLDDEARDLQGYESEEIPFMKRPRRAVTSSSESDSDGTDGGEESLQRISDLKRNKAGSSNQGQNQEQPA